jgi:DNA-binding LacI/PurR family transcriptional regulator
LRTVAAAAGVSIATASYAYNRPSRVSGAARERVLKVAEELGYPGPDPVGRSLRRRRVGAIGVLFTTPLSYAFTDPYCSALLAGVARVIERRRIGLALMPLSPHADGPDEAAVRESVEAARSVVVDGVIADGIFEGHPALRVLAQRRVALVRSVDTPADRCVVLDELAAGRALGAHLAGLGHRHVAVLLDSVDSGLVIDADERMLFPYGRLRLAGLREGLGREAVVTAVRVGANSEPSGQEAACTVLAHKPRVTAIAAVSDVLALGALREIRTRGIAISVTGFDDVPAASVAGLTTVSQPIEKKGEVMARMLVDPDFTRRRVVLPTQLVVRSSTGPAASRAGAQP